jgi:hypothetical protein
MADDQTAQWEALGRQDGESLGQWVARLQATPVAGKDDAFARLRERLLREALALRDLGIAAAESPEPAAPGCGSIESVWKVGTDRDHLEFVRRHADELRRLLEAQESRP